MSIAYFAIRFINFDDCLNQVNLKNIMATQMTAARRGVATDEMKQVAKDEDVTLDWLISKNC